MGWCGDFTIARRKHVRASTYDDAAAGAGVAGLAVGGGEAVGAGPAPAGGGVVDVAGGTGEPEGTGVVPVAGGGEGAS